MNSIILRAPEVRAALDTGVVEIVRAVKNLPFAKTGFPHKQGQTTFIAVDLDEANPYDVCAEVKCSYGQPGERRWVRETWALHKSNDRYGLPTYPPWPLVWYNDGKMPISISHVENFPGRWRSPVTMPRWASRLTLEITDVRVISVQDVSNEDALRAGVRIPDCGNSEFDGLGDWEPRDGFADIWDSRAKAGERWEDNPPVWVINARRVQE